MTYSKVDIMKHQLQKLTIFLSKLLQNSSQSSVTAICSSKSALALSLKNSIHYYYHFSLLSLSQCSLCKKPILNILQFLLYGFLGNRYVTWFLHSYSITGYYYDIIISHFTRTNFNTYWNTLREKEKE